MESGIDRAYHPADILQDHWKEIKSRWGRKREFSISFLPELDKAIWGLKRKTLVVVAGRPSMGKSTLMLQMAYTFALEGKKAYYFSLEMSKEECIERLISNYCRIENFHLHTGQVNKSCDDEMNCFSNTLNDMKLLIIEAWGRSFGEILDIINTFQKPDIIFIDYINMIRQGTLSKKSAIDEYIKDLRCLALDRNFCAVLGAQINRDVHRNQDPNKDVPVPNMWHLKETGNIEEHSDVILITHWPHYYRFAKRGDDFSDEKEYIIKVAKNRSGRTGIFVCDFLPEYCRITNREAKTEPNDWQAD